MNLARNHTRLLFAILVSLLIAAGQLQSRLLPRPSSAAVSPAVVISQVYGGGGNGGSTFRNDFIELFNFSNATVDISNWSVQYSSATGTSWQVTNLCPSGNTCTIAPGRYYLIQEAQGAGGTTNLPTPDASGVIAMSATAGKVALVNNINALTGACPVAGSMIDLVGYGGANCFEGSAAAAAPGNSTSVVRINSGCTDTDKNNSDFVLAAPGPRNSTTPSVTCGVSPSPSPTPPPSPTPSCGVERWSVKTGTDADAAQVGFVPQGTSIATMRSWPAPASTPANNRVAPYETTVWTVTATLTQYKLEDDSDYHLVIRDQAGNTIVTEIPLPGCVGAGSPFAVSIANARAKFDAMFTPDGNFQFVNVPIQITGVAMFDFAHGQTGAAPNGIEIHPVLDISFPASATVQFSVGSYSVNEGTAGATVTINRGGDTTAVATVDYATSDTAGASNCNVFSGVASSRCDYLTTLGTVHFAANEVSRTLAIPIVDDSWAEGSESFTITLSNPTGASLGPTATASVAVTDDENVTGANPADGPAFFVRQQYLDFLNREPDSSGLSFWTGEIDNCTPKPQCTEAKRINVSAAFFLSIEFQGTGYLVERIYKAAYGDTGGTSTFPAAHQLQVPTVRLNEFLADTQEIGSGVIVGQTGWEQALENNKQAFTAEFVQRTRFSVTLPTSMTPAQFVDAIFANTGVTPTMADRNTVIGEFGGAATTSDMNARSRALRDVAEHGILKQQEFNRAFVLMQYFGYLRRNPNDPPDTDYTGYDFWLTKLNQFNGNFQNAEMVKAFINSTEYRSRFGP